MAQTKSKVSPIPRLTRAGARKASQEAKAASQNEEFKQQSEQESDDKQSSISASDSGEEEGGSVDEDGMYDVIYVGSRSSSPVNVSSNVEDETEIGLSVENNVGDLSIIQEQAHVWSELGEEIESLQGAMPELEEFDSFEFQEISPTWTYGQEETQGMSSGGGDTDGPNISQYQERFRCETPEMQLFSTLVALQPQSLRQVTPQAEDDIIFSNFVHDGDYVHGEVDKTSVGSIPAGTNNSGNLVEVQTLGVESDPKDICSAPALHGVSDAAHPTADESTNQTFGSMAAEGCVSAEHAPPTAVSQAFLTPIHEVTQQSTSVWDDFDEPYKALSPVWKGPNGPRQAFGTLLPPRQATIGSTSGFIDPGLFELGYNSVTTETQLTELSRFAPAGVIGNEPQPPPTAFLDNPVTTETQLTELSQNTLADVTGNKMHPALGPSRRTITPPTRKAGMRKPSERKPRSKKAIAASKQIRVESVVEPVAGSVVDSVPESAHQSVPVAPESYPSHADHETWYALTDFIQMENAKGSTDVQTSGPLSSLTIPVSSNTSSIIFPALSTVMANASSSSIIPVSNTKPSIIVPALPAIVADASSSSTVPAVVTEKKRGSNNKAYVRPPRTKARLEQTRIEKAANLAELDELIADAHRRALIEAATGSTCGPVEFKQGPNINKHPKSLTHGIMHVTFANKGEMPAYIEAAYLEKVRRFTASPTGSMRGRRARDEGTDVEILNLPEIPRWQCKICNEILPTSWALKLHRKIHPVHSICEVCNKTFTRGPSHRRHMGKAHPGFASCTCYCGRVFSNGKFLEKHQRTCDTYIRENDSEFSDPEEEQTGESSASQQRTSNKDDIVMGNTSEGEDEKVDEDEEMVDIHDNMGEEEEQGMTRKGKEVYRY
ncbi:hypothetical protein P167DRAFT_576088 [Morchella conica CCBAS932]|uniref:C2H2-type domain-containing protein n=1 Tax=Morchella conica CCBAS932 TaxID=1392247 RepID=A0A3N4KJK2_9PEZI|nr:hypothetical protein P167DRAFT_576088 [Morchella conica CCBAS932]